LSSSPKPACLFRFTLKPRIFNFLLMIMYVIAVGYSQFTFRNHSTEERSKQSSSRGPIWEVVWDTVRSVFIFVYATSPPSPDLTHATGCKHPSLRMGYCNNQRDMQHLRLQWIYLTVAYCERMIMVTCWIGNHIMFMLSKLATLMLVTKKPLYVLFVFKKHKNRTAQNDNQLTRDLFTQPEIGRRLNRMWPEDLIR
jgi:uncharacterized membrane protein